MASDYRAGLYARYVSAFKGTPAHLEDDGADQFWDHKFLPLLADLNRSAAILDLGCGSGSLLAYLQRRGFSQAGGVDISAEQIALADQRGVRAEQHDGLAYLATHSQHFETILAVDVLEHFTRDELAGLVGRMFGALKPGGRLVVQTANGAGLFPGQVIYGDLTHQTIFTPESLAQLLRSVGFGNLACYETGPVPFRIRGRLDVALWTAVKVVANSVRHVETGKRQ
ncbi:MAG: class I SAM-dependent methyltransferase, partial [Chloroflexi bacterium]|nr:class I SAM-dependent methyltransferase [Chloroflexota bacterium]